MTSGRRQSDVILWLKFYKQRHFPCMLLLKQWMNHKTNSHPRDFLASLSHTTTGKTRSHSTTTHYLTPTRLVLVEGGATCESEYRASPFSNTICMQHSCVDDFITYLDYITMIEALLSLNFCSAQSLHSLKMHQTTRIHYIMPLLTT